MILPKYIQISITAGFVDIISCFFNFLMVLIAGISALFAWKAYHHQRERSKKVAACELARYYADIIINENGFISNVLLKSQVDQYIKKSINFDQMKDFDLKELENILDDKHIKYSDFMKSIEDIDPFIILNCRMNNLDTESDRSGIFKQYVTVDKETGKMTMRNESFLISDFSQSICELLNQLEWFCMNCRYGLADEELLYQSLHKSFFSTIWVLYPFIAQNNLTNEDKLFTNVIWLFDHWYSRFCEIKEEAENKRKEIQVIMDELQPKVFVGRGIK